MTTDPVLTLWYRVGRGHPWQAVYAGPTSQACTDAMADDRTHHHGEWYASKGAKPPKNLNLCVPRRAET